MYNIKILVSVGVLFCSFDLIQGCGECRMAYEKLILNKNNNNK